MANPQQSQQASQSAQQQGQAAQQQAIQVHHPFTVVKTIAAVRADSLVWGNMTGASTVVTVDGALVTAAQANVAANAKAFLRRFAFHEVDGPDLTLRAASTSTSGAYADTAVSFYGTYDEALALAGRKVLLVHDDGRTQTATVATTAAAISPAGKDTVNPWMWTLNLDQVPIFTREDFDESAPRVTVYGNLVPATQGKTIAETPIGSGDARQTFQTFALPKTPLTYLLDVSQTPAQSPELTVYVGDTAWTRVDTLFDAAPDAQVYVVREDAEGTSFVQFGDGKSGARLPSGRNNVVARYRTGSGAHGALLAETTPQASSKLTGLDKVYLPQPITTGAAPESEDNARAAAPARVQSLGRLVSVADFEAEALALPHVVKATAAWAAPDGVPLVQLTILTESESAADLAAVAAALETSNRTRGASRFPISVARGLRQYLAIALTAGYDASRREEDVKADIARALGAAGAEADGIDGARGLFGLHGRRFGQSAHVSQIIGAAQQVPGVAWVTLQSAQLVPPGNPVETDPAKLVPPPLDAVPSQSIGCGDTFILALYTAHLTVNLAAA